MAAPPGMTPQQMAAFQQHMQQQVAAEAAKRGMTPEAFVQMQREQVAAEAAKHGLTPEQYVQGLRMRALQQRAAAQQAQQGQPGQPGQPQQQGPPGQPMPGPVPPQQMQKQVNVNPNNPPDPKAIALAKWLRTQDLKTRTCILDGQRKDMFKVKRAIRAIESPAYAKASAKSKGLLPPVTDHASAENVFKLLPLSLLALRVTKQDPHAGHDHGKTKRVKGLWTVKIEQHQETDPMMHYVFLYEGSQWKQKAMAVGVVLAIFAVVLFPLWPIVLRQGVWYLSVGMMGLLGAFFAMAIFRLILFCITVFAVPPGLWLFPNLFEDVGFFDSFKPVWGWQEKKKKKKAKSAKKAPSHGAQDAPEKSAVTADAAPATATDQAPTAATPATIDEPSKRALAASVEDAEEE